MINIERFNAEDEFKKLLEQMPKVPANVVISEKTGFLPSQVSGIMKGKVKASPKFVEAFKKGFKLNSDTIQEETKNPPPINDEGLKDKMIALLEKSLERVEAELKRVLEENKRFNKQ